MRTRASDGRQVVAGRIAGPVGSRRGGFTLIELMFIVTLVGIIAAMAIPTLHNSRKYSNEGSAVASMRSFTTAQMVYRTRFGAYATMANLHAKGFLDDNFIDGQKSGYVFTTPVDPTQATWSILAQPVDPGVSGDRSFFTDESGVIRFRDGGAATAADMPIQ